MAKRLLRIAGYVAFGLFSLLIGFYLTFPGDAVGQRLAHELRMRSGGKIAATFGEVSLYRLTGVEAQDVRLLFNTTDPPTEVTLDAARGRLQILPLLLFNLSFATEVELQDGTVAAEITPNQDGILAMELEIDELNLAQPPLLPTLVGLPIGGVVDGSGEVRWSQDPRRSSGEAKLSLSKLSVGPGEPVKGFSLPNQITFGKLDLAMTLEGGQLRFDRFEQDSKAGKPDVAIKLANLSANLRRSIATTSYDACLALKLDEAFLAENRKFEAILDLAKIPAPVGPGFRSDDEGFLHASFSGTFSGKPKPRRRLCSEKSDRPADRPRGREARPKGRPPKRPK